jgi:hypothetical protein
MMRHPPRRRPIRRPSWLDQWVYRFQHRWETNPQYRAAVSGVCGLVLIVLMCSCTGILATVTNSALAGAGGGNGSTGNTNTGAATVQAQATFPTMTIPPYTVSTIPAGNIPNSQTPPPGPTATPTDLPATPTDTPGGPGGGPAGTCSGTSAGATWQFSSPCPQSPGQSGSVTVYDPAYAGRTVNALVSFGVCSGTVQCTVLYTPNLGYHFDSSGTLVLPYTIPSQAQPNAAPESGMVNITNGPTVLFTGPYLQ